MKATSSSSLSLKSLHNALKPLAEANKAQSEKLQQLQGQLVGLARRVGNNAGNNEGGMFTSRDLYLIGVILIFQVVFAWLMR